MKTLVWIVGPPAVGKMTVGRALGRLTGLPLFHNHLSIEAVLPVFDYGTPAFGRLVGDFRRAVLREAAESDHAGLIFTYVWAFDDPAEERFVDEISGIFEARGGRAVFAELQADLETRRFRNEHPERLAEKASKRDLERSRTFLVEAEERFRLSSDGRFPRPDHLLVDNTDLSPEDVAHRIAVHFDLPRGPIA